MAITQTFEKRELHITLGENEAPASWAWKGVLFTRNDDGSDAAPPQQVMRPATTDEVTAHIGQASVDQSVAFDRFNSQIADLTQKIADLTEERDALKEAAAVVAAANAKWDAAVTPKLVAVGAVAQ